MSTGSGRGSALQPWESDNFRAIKRSRRLMSLRAVAGCASDSGQTYTSSGLTQPGGESRSDPKGKWEPY
ncbi:hypothetical protein AOXY_G35833 [Acipenser oxyrinchus oxyrinchus]|uniref:Uncharacterized protein n=1 Tax=Acipenser oxyrinchus oxyrinchus TaxID=40147 RepID=A0AAD8FP51_ACIOX|nr:hypothetical protein AOXY_G35831 [Acipenser oxyrinchus oxyrinchus]KAK1146433.1 hypothetical protein AOXY_G35833 [Acipenser oxyrinchus oxyrinchus]